jgi:signal transduction histidine kinase
VVGAVLAWAARRLARAQRRLQAQSADLARANQELDFAARTGAIGAISAHLIHGLNNPLSGLEGFVSDQASPGGESGEAWRAAVETTRRLRSLVNEAVAVLREEALDSAGYDVPARELAEAARAHAAESARRAGITLESVVTGEGELAGRNANLARLVLANLVANAIEASPAGSKVTLEANSVPGAVEFLVRDEGAGIPREVEAALFRPMRSSKTGGGGIGLAISRQLARHAGGELEFFRNPERGSTFRLRVPLATPPALPP